MRIAVGLLVVGMITLCKLSSVHTGDLEWYRWKDDKDIRFGGFVDEMHAVRVIASEDGSDRRMIYGDEEGRLHAVRFKGGRSQEEWVSEHLQDSYFKKIDEGECLEIRRFEKHYLKPVTAEVFVADIDADGELEIVAYSEFGGIVFYRADNYKKIWSSPPCQFGAISGMVLANVDDDPQLELVFCGEAVEDLKAFYQDFGRWPQEFEVSRLFVFDCLNYFVEWTAGESGLYAQSIVVANLDTDEGLEIALNTGFIVDTELRQVEWQFSEGFGEKIGYADMDGDGILELIAESRSLTHPRHFLRLFDVELQRESFLHKATSKKDSTGHSPQTEPPD